MTTRGWRLRAVVWVVVVLAAFCAAGPEHPAVAAGTEADLGPLPADRYRETADDYRSTERASALLVRQCMADRGHPDFPLDPRFPSDGVAVSLVASEYGVLDLDGARRWGYGWDPAKHPAAAAKGRRMTAAEFADWPACNTQASRRLDGGADAGQDLFYASGRSVEVGKAVKRDPRLRAIWDEWSRCVADQGFTRYPDPLAAHADPAWQRGSDGDTTHSRRERATAVADVTCKRRHRTVQRWHALLAQAQAADITRHQDRYAAGLRALTAYRATVASVLRTLG